MLPRLVACFMILTPSAIAVAQQRPLVLSGGREVALQNGSKLAVSPSVASAASLNVPPGVAPEKPENGDLWVTSAGLGLRVNGYTLPPLGGAGVTPSLTVGTSIFPTNAGGRWTKYDATSNILTNVLGARSGYFGAAAKDGLTWAENYMPGTDTQSPHAVQLYALSTSGNYGGTFGSRSSDNKLKAPQNVIGSVGLAVADNQASAHRVWGGYSVAYQAPAGKQAILIGHEITTDNRAADAPAVTPSSPNPAGLVNGLRITCGDGEQATHFRCSSAISTVFNGAVYRTGLLFADGSIGKVAGFADAIALPNDYGVSWNAGGGAPEWRLFSNAGPLTYSNSIVLGTNTVDFYLNGGGARPLHLSPEGTETSGVHRLVPMTFARLPRCDADHAGSMAFVSDARDAVASWNQVVRAGGGTTKTFVKCNGTTWNAF